MDSKGVSASAAGGFAALVPFFGVIAMLVAPALSNKIQKRAVFVWGPYLVGIVTIFAMIYSSINGFWVLLPLMGLIINTPYVIAVFVIPVDLIPRENLGAATGLVLTVGYFAALIGPWVTGRVWDATGSVTGVMVSLMIAFAIGAVIAFFIPKNPEKIG